MDGAQNGSSPELSESAATKSELQSSSSFPHRILVVDDEREVREVVADLLRHQQFEAVVAADADAAVSALKAQSFACVVTDIKMPNRDGMWLLSEIRQHYPDTAVIMMTGYGQVETAVGALRVGAADYLEKPVRIQQLAASLEKALEHRRLVMENRSYQNDLEAKVEQKTEQLQAAYKEVNGSYNRTLEALVTALDARECETGNHSQRVVQTTLAIADRMGIVGEEREHIARGALLHDIGKIGVPDHVLLKPGRLNDEEWVEMRKHPDIGARILSGIDFLNPAAEIVLAHQERFDGTGYPRKLKGEEIPLGARIFAVADALDAITSDRPYRRGRSFDYAQEEIARYSGTQFDPEVVRHFLTMDEAEWRHLRGEKSPIGALPATNSLE